MYYNTTHEPNKAELERKNLTQESKVLKFFDENRHRTFTPCEVQKLMRQQLTLNSPLTSIRRSITDLTIQGFLIKSDIKRKGIYGRPNYTWSYNHNN